MNLTYEGNTLIADMTGDIDHNSSYEIRDRIDGEIKKMPVANLVFNMENTDFMDSSGIGLILGRYRLMNGIGGKVCIVKPKDNIKKIINMSGLHKIISVYSSVEEAVCERRIAGGK